MTAKEFFRQVRRAEAELKLINAKMRHYEDIGLSIGVNLSAVPGSAHKGASRVELAACGAVDALRDLEQQKREFSAIVARAEHVIKMIQQERYRQILSYRYLCGWSFRSISDELHYTDPNSVYRAHGWALREAQRILDEQERAGNGQQRS